MLGQIWTVTGSPANRSCGYGYGNQIVTATDDSRSSGTGSAGMRRLGWAA